MAANTKSARRSKASPAEADVIPSPANVRARAAKIRDAWTPEQRRRRAQVARYLLLEQLLDGSP